LKKYTSEFSGGALGPLVRDLTALEEGEVQELFFQGSVWLGNKRIRDSQEIHPSGLVQIYRPSRPIHPFTLETSSVVFEDENILVVYKPPNLNTVQSPFSDLDNLTHGVQRYLDAQIGRTPGYQVNAVHRLDMPAQGLVHFGKNKEAEKKMFSLFQNRRIRKIYWALLPRIELENLQTTWFIRDDLDWQGKVKRACSFLKFQKDLGESQLWTASPLTGRPHQLRKHFATYLKPIIGDVMYGEYDIPAELKLASVYSRFIHPYTKKIMENYRVSPGFLD